MNLDEQQEYFEAMEWFNRKYIVGGSMEKLLKHMYSCWPRATLLLAHQGFFIALLKGN